MRIILALTLLTSFSCAVAGPPSSPVAGYRSWTRVTPRLVGMPESLAVDCAARAPSPHNPHWRAFFHVYVNSVGRPAMVNQRRPAFPVGTLVVKEKFPRRDAPKPELLTVMRKREKGFDAANGDWEYLAQELPGGRLKAPENLKKCQSCHRKVSERDYVFRDYLPAAVERRLR
jgi:hypothetical protein